MKRYRKAGPGVFRVPAALILSLLWLVAIDGTAPAAAARTPSPEIAWSGSLSAPSAHTPEWIGYRFLESRKREFGLRNPRADMKVTGTARLPDGGTRIVYQRYIFRTPVWGDSLSIDIDRHGVIRRVTGRIHANLLADIFHRPKPPVLSAYRAAAKASEWLKSMKIAAAIGSVSACYLPDRPGVPLVYLVSLEGGRRLFVHAQTGRVIRADI